MLDKTEIIGLRDAFRILEGSGFGDFTEELLAIDTVFSDDPANPFFLSESEVKLLRDKVTQLYQGGIPELSRIVLLYDYILKQPACCHKEVSSDGSWLFTR